MNLESIIEESRIESIKFVVKKVSEKPPEKMWETLIETLRDLDPQENTVSDILNQLDLTRMVLGSLTPQKPYCFPYRGPKYPRASSGPP
jgi:hypothetical protein